MRNIILILLFILSACSYKSSDKSNEPKTESKRIVSHNILFSEAVKNEREVNLSEIADTVIFLPLESKNEKSLIQSLKEISLSKGVIIASPLIFGIDGKFLFEVGKRGSGPGEEIYLHRIVKKDSAFFSSADKLIAYDSNGVYSGKEKNIVGLRALDFGNACSNLALCVADTVFFLDQYFNIKKSIRTVPDWHEKSTLFNIDSSIRFFTEYKDSVLFYNYANDTVYRVLDTGLSPRWIFSLGEEKIPLKHLLGNEGARLGTGGKYFEGGNLEEWDYIKDTDNKIRPFAVYETDSFLIINWLFMREFWQLRNTKPSVLQVAYFNKNIGETVAVKGENGFIDDISSLEHFYPRLGTYENYMVSVHWSFELKEKIENKRAKGEYVDKNLVDLTAHSKDDDNPVLVFVRLKE